MLVLSRNFPNAALPRLGLWVEGLVRHAQEWDSTVIAPVPYCPPLPFLSENYTRFRRVPHQTRIANADVRHARLLTFPGGRFRPLEGQAYLAGVAGAVADASKGRPVDVIHAHFTYPDGWAAVKLGQRLNAPVVITEHASWRSWFATSPFVRARTLEAIAGCAFHVSVGAALRTEIAEMAGDSPKLRVIPCGVDGATFSLPAAGVPKKAHQVLFVGAVRRVKGLDVLLGALHQLARSGRAEHLVVVGDAFYPEYRQALHEAEQMATDLGLSDRVTFLGGQDPSVVARLMQESAVVVLPSRRETLGMVLVEALACGTPVVATDCGGPSDIVTPATGRLTPIEDPAAMAKAIADVIDHPDQFDAGVLRAHALEKFAWSRVAAEYRRLYELALDSRRVGRPLA